MADKHSKVFNLIAPMYVKFYDFQIKYYERTLIRAKKAVDITSYKTALDIGSGTGALCYVLYKKGSK